MQKLPIQPGDILLYSGTTLLDDLIRIVTMSNFNHVAVVVPGGQMVEALPGGVRIAPITTMGEGVWHVSTEQIWSPAATAFVKSVVGESYSYLNDLLAGLGYPPATDKEWECAQLGAKLLSILGIDMPAGIDTPEKVAMVCARRGFLFQFLDGQFLIADSESKEGVKNV